MKNKKVTFLKDRFKLIKRLIKNKKVLDIGCVQHNAYMENNKNWIHKKIRKYAKSLTGVGFEKKEVEILRKKGYNIKYGDFETIDLKEKFEVIFAGNLIEHLFNQGLFLDNVNKHLEKEGTFILTTINCFGIRNFIWSILKGKVPVNVTHTCYYDFETLKFLLKSKGFQIKEHHYFTDAVGWRYIIERILMVRKIFAPLILIVCQKKN